MPCVDLPVAWSHPPDVLEPGASRVDVWRIPLDLPAATVKRLVSNLSAGEARRAARFRFPADRQRYSVAHGCLRDILARYLRCKPGQLDFSINESGKPGLPDHPLQFNLSHSGEVALVAVAQDRQVGIDVERIRAEIEFERIARRFFSSQEVSELLSLPPGARQAAFFDCWTRKEAVIKAHGLGLSLSLDSFDVSLAPGEPALLRATRPDPGEAARWTLLALDVGPAYKAALAVEKLALSFSKGLALSSRPGLVNRLPEDDCLAFRFWDWHAGYRPS